MATQKAVVVTSSQTANVVEKPIPALRDDYILVKTISVALNPTDWKHIEYMAPPGVTVGCDYAGIVQEVGKSVKKPFKKGDRICGFAHGCNTVQPEDGAFAEYIVVKGDVQMKIPDHMSFQEAATLGVGVFTVAQALYQSLQLAWPTEPLKQRVPLLLYGGSTATGTLAIQFAKESGYEVLTTCSPHNFDLVKKLGADAVFDYRDPGTATAIREQTKNGLKLVLDNIAEGDSPKYCDAALSTEGGEYGALGLVKIERENVHSKVTVAYTIFGEDFKFREHDMPAKPDDRAFAESFLPVIEKLLGEGKVKAHPPRVGAAGLNGVLEGLKYLKEGKVSGEKLVYNVAETP